MQILIDIDKERYNEIVNHYDTFPKQMRDYGVKAIRHGTPIPDNATNGDVIKAMFPNTEIMITDERVFLRDGTIVMIYPLTWWNAPYQKGGKWMQIVIEIPEENYNNKTLVDYFGCYSKMLDATIYNGTVLPKHGRLGDLDYLYKKFEANGCKDSNVYRLIKDEPTIIESNKENIWNL